MELAAPTFSNQELMQIIPADLLNLSHDGFFALDRECRFRFWTQGMTEITGLSATEVLGQNAFDVLPFLRQIGHQDLFASVLRGGTVVAPTRPYSVPESGRTGFFRANYYPYRTSVPGEVAGLLAIVSDVTDQKKALDMQAETEGRFRKMADSSPVMLWMSGKDGKCNFFNQSWLQFSGKPMEQELGVGWAEGVHAFDFQRCMDIYLASFSARMPFEMEYRLLRRDSQYRWILDRGVPRYSPDRVFEGYIGSCIDITERKMFEEELQKSIREREEFLSIASHELKTPLTSISLQIQLFEHLFTTMNTGDLSTVADRMKSGVKIVGRQLRHMTDLIEKLLDISRIESGHFKMDLDNTDLAEVAQGIAERLGELAAQAGCAIRVVKDSPVAGQWDRSRLEQVVSNLVTNAVKYAPGGPIEIRVRMEAEKAILEVTDQGPGIPQDRLDSIFDKFQQGPKAKSPGGLGLGLYIVRQIVASHGGQIAAQNGPERGVTFRVELPSTLDKQ